MAFLGDLVLRMKAETADFRSDLNKAQSSVQTMSRNIAQAATVAIGALGGLSAVGLAVSMAKGVKETLEVAEGMNKLTQRTGIATETLSAYRVSAQLADVPQEALNTGLKKLAVNMAASAGGAKEQSKVFEALGIKVTNTNGSLRKTDEVLEEVARSFEEMQDGPGKAAIAVALFGKAGDTMIPFLNTLRETKDEAKRLGVVFSGDFARSAEEFNDNMKRIHIIGERFHIMIAEAMLPRLVALSQEFVQASVDGNRFLAMLNALSQFTGWTDPQRIKDQKEMISLVEREEAIRARMADIQNASNIFGGPPNRVQQQQLNASRLALFDIQARRDALTRSLDTGDSALQSALRPEVIKRAAPVIDKTPDTSAAKAAAELKQYITALQGLEKQLFALNHEGQIAIVTYETTKGSLAGLLPAHKEELLLIAQKIDTLKRETDMRAQMRVGVEAEMKIREELANTTREYVISNREANQDAAREISLIGTSREERERLNAVRQIEIDLRRRVASLSQEDSEAITKHILLMTEEAEKQKAIALETLRVRREAERSWVNAANEAMKEYIDDATNAALITRNIFSTVFSSMEDAVVQFAMTGKVNFKQFADSIISDLIRIQFRAAAAEGMKSVQQAGGISSLLGGLFGGGGMASDPLGITAYASGTPYVPRTGLAFLHQGEAVIPAAENARGGGDTWNVDMRGASVEAVQRLEVMVARLNGSIESRAVSAVFDQQMRGNRV